MLKLESLVFVCSVKGDLWCLSDDGGKTERPSVVRIKMALLTDASQEIVIHNS